LYTSEKLLQVKNSTIKYQFNLRDLANLRDIRAFKVLGLIIPQAKVIVNPKEIIASKKIERE